MYWLALMIVVTRCQILRLKCTKFNFGWGSAPDPAGGAYSVPPDPLAGFKGPTSKGREGKGVRIVVSSTFWVENKENLQLHNHTAENVT